MEDIFRPIYQERASHPDTLAVVMMEKRNEVSPLTDNMDAVLFIVVKEAEQPVFIKHYEYMDNSASLHIVTQDQVEEWLLLGTNRRIVEWIINGRVLFDRNDYHAKLAERLQNFPFSERKFKIGLEFAKLIRRFYEGKAFFEAKQYLDAYNHIVHALHHLARLEVIDRGFHPEITVWKQVKQIEPQVYKLYQELVESGESLEKRLELLFLASDFLIHSKTEIGASHLLSVIEEKEQWLFGDLLNHDEIKCYSLDLSVLVEYLVEKEFIKTIKIETKGNRIFHRGYSLLKKY
ncbi:hypothetical protein GJU40_16485 [Bacillus lacus]|uniref:Nucleotidyltransferase-like domain-containing protein n=1 Tax=Metabacillus lacus TaxID=1983721 RepID=A0A7X2J1Q8_9BACI|nr:nucleotidyltransferase-like protein [Metabacillus lacus]MRX73740.1 hypothetical protein [Metabacillus lacus]